MQSTDLALKRAYAFWLSAIEDSHAEKSQSNYKDHVKRIGDIIFRD